MWDITGILIFHGNPNAAQVTIMTLNLWGHQYCSDWGGVMNWCVKLRVGEYPSLHLSSFQAFGRHQYCGDWGGAINWCVKWWIGVSSWVGDYPRPHLSSFLAFGRHQYCCDWGWVKNRCVKLRVGDYPPSTYPVFIHSVSPPPNRLKNYSYGPVLQCVNPCFRIKLTKLLM